MNILSVLESNAAGFGIRPGRWTVISASLAHVAASMLGIIALAVRAPIVLLESFNAERFLEVIREKPETSAWLVPTAIQKVLDLSSDPSDYVGLARMAYGGAPMSPGLMRRALAAMGCEFMQSYGLTETTCGGAILVVRGLADADAHPERLSSIGHADSHAELGLFVPGTDHPSPRGAAGELRIRGSGIMAGYWRRPDETAAAITPDGWLRTGDLATSDEEGYYWLAGRLNDMILTGGENVHPAEVERELDDVPGVRASAVVGIADSHWGERVVAAIEVDGSATFDERKAIERLRTRLSSYKIPKEFVVIDAIPRNASGKIARRELAQQVVRIHEQETADAE